MLSYCLKCRKNTENRNPKVVRTKNGRIMLVSRCSVCNSKKSEFLKEKIAKGLVSSLTGIKLRVLSDIPFSFVLKVLTS